MTEGNKKLIRDLKALLVRAENGEFDDFDTEHATPKILLDSELNGLRMKVQNGEYD